MKGFLGRAGGPESPDGYRRLYRLLVRVARRQDVPQLTLYSSKGNIPKTKGPADGVDSDSSIHQVEKGSQRDTLN